MSSIASASENRSLSFSLMSFIALDFLQFLLSCLQNFSSMLSNFSSTVRFMIVTQKSGFSLIFWLPSQNYGFLWSAACIPLAMTFFNKAIHSFMEKLTRASFTKTAFGVFCTLTAWPTTPAPLKKPSVGFESLVVVSAGAIAALIAESGSALVAEGLMQVVLWLTKFSN